MVPQDRFGEGAGEIPFLDDQGADLFVGERIDALFRFAETNLLIVAAFHDQLEFGPVVAVHDDFADVVEQSGEKRVFQVNAGDLSRDQSGCQRGTERMFPEHLFREAEGLVNLFDRCGDHDTLEGRETEENDG